MEQKQNKILIAVPTGGMLEAATAAWLATMAVKYPQYIATGRPADYVRNSIVKVFLKGDWTHLFFLDSDIEPPLDCIERLLALDSPLASGCYALNMPDGFRWALLNKNDKGEYKLLNHLTSIDEPFWADATGAGCLLIKKEAIERFDWPWFSWLEKSNGTTQSEDVQFFKKCNLAGYRVKIDPQVVCRHIKKINITNLMLAIEAKTRKDL